MQKIVSAVGLSDQKPLSDKEDMGPAGHMQGRYFPTHSSFFK